MGVTADFVPQFHSNRAAIYIDPKPGLLEAVFEGRSILAAG